MNPNQTQSRLAAVFAGLLLACSGPLMGQEYIVDTFDTSNAPDWNAAQAIFVTVQEQVQFHRALAAPPGPIEHAGAQFDGCAVQAQ
jgi:hypothetical protein